MAKLPERWTHKHNAYYYIPRASEKSFFDGKSWFRLGKTYPEALKTYAERLEIQMGDDLASVIDRYTIEVMPKFKPNTITGYSYSLARIRKVLGHNKVALIQPQIVYQYMDHIAKEHSMNLANSDLKALRQVLSYAVRWGVVDRNAIKGEVKPYGEREGVKKARERYVEDWELAEWSKVATPIQRAFAALVMLTGARKGEIFQLTRNDAKDGKLKITSQKTGKITLFVITPALQEAIDFSLSTHRVSSMYLLPSTKGQCQVNTKGNTPSFDKAWRRSMNKAIETTGLKETFTRHDLRAKVGSDAATDERAQQLLGHSYASMTRKHYRRKIPVINPTK